MKYSRYLNTQIKLSYGDKPKRLRKKKLATTTIREIMSHFERYEEYRKLQEKYNSSMKRINKINCDDELFDKTYLNIRRTTLNLYIIIYRFSAKLIKKLYDKNDYEKSVDNIIDFLNNLYTTDELDVCKSINNALITSGINNIKFKYKLDSELISAIEETIAYANSEASKYETQLKIFYKKRYLVEKVYNALKLNAPPQTFGVYFLFSDNLELKYIGMSKNLLNRVLQSLKDKQLKSFAYLVCENEEDALSIEKHYIYKYQPERNSEHRWNSFKYDGKIPEVTQIYILNTEGISVSATNKTRLPKNHVLFTTASHNII